MVLHRTATLALLWSGLLSLVSCSAPAGGGAGFTDAFFDTAVLNELMSDAACTKLRFYNARRSSTDTRGTVIAIAIRSDGTEIYDGAGLKYRMYERITGSATTITALTKEEARTRVRYVPSAGDKSYAVEWTKGAIGTYLRAGECNGIRLVPEKSDGNWSMRMHPIKLASGSATLLSAPASSLATEPCPTFCGPAGNYIF